jgi:hypothetical protein
MREDDRESQEFSMIEDRMDFENNQKDSEKPMFEREVYLELTLISVLIF